MIIRHTGVGNKIVNYLLSGNSVFKRHAWQGKFLYQFVIGSISTKHGQNSKSAHYGIPQKTMPNLAKTL